MSRGTYGPNRARRLRALSTLGAMGLVAGLASGMLAPPAGADPAPTAAVAENPHGKNPVACDGQVYVSFGNPEDQLYTADRGPGAVQFSPLGDPTPFLYNAIGVNPEDRFLYGTSFGGADNELIRFDGHGKFTNLGPIEGLPSDLYISGTFDDEGNYYILADNNRLIYRVGIDHHGKASVTGTIDVEELEDQALDIFDIAFRDGFLWGSTEAGAIARIDIANESVDFFPGVLPGGEDFGGVFVYGNGDLGFFRNSGTLHRLHVKNAAAASPEFTVLSVQDTTPATNLDATSCFLDSSADLAVHKRAPKTVESGATVTYRITVRNEGKEGKKGKKGGDSSGWSLTDRIPSQILNPATTTEGCTITDGTLSCTGGPLQKGHHEQITVTGTAAEVTEATTVSNTATVFGDDADPHKANNTDTATTEITPRPQS
ncbi:DUF11 domain-containing protein [Streptomyces sp. NBC_00091]|uniref:DUF11 domain-containing protein n=1 Tax=Streptomyces sp. NBC_00091 TaxID=2975648 RepID=UPI00224D175B|nr:DUF11 domain-containing protein [Streptomyces sp. NBC_00091]MCX5376703.1 DUF11 domain-containing protein [Streptomyces sp. NBC_00091]